MTKQQDCLHFLSTLLKSTRQAIATIEDYQHKVPNQGEPN